MIMGLVDCGLRISGYRSVSERTSSLRGLLFQKHTLFKH